MSAPITSISKGDWVVVRGYGDTWALRRAYSAVLAGHKFPVVYVVRPDRSPEEADDPYYQSAWPAEDVHRVEFTEDPGVGWVFQVDSLEIIGGAETREEAEKRVVEAAAFTWSHGTNTSGDTCQDHCPYGVACDCQGLHGTDARKRARS